MTETGVTRTSKPPVIIERTLRFSPQEVWEMWTTREGLEAWWGPEGFASTVRLLELRVGGRLEIAMRATDPEEIAFLDRYGSPGPWRSS